MTVYELSNVVLQSSSITLMFDVGKLIKFYQSKIFRGSISNLK